MEEKKKNEAETSALPPKDGPDCGKPVGLKAWLSNFWYHYKFAVIAAVFIVAVIVVSTVQLATKEEPDIEILYAGGVQFSHSSIDGDIPPYIAAENALKQYAEDYDGDGTTLLDLTDLYCPSAADIEAAQKNGESVDASLYTADQSTFTEAIRYAEYYVCILSAELYAAYDTTANGSYFTSLSEYLSEDSTVRLTESGTGAYLHSTSLGESAAFADLPEDTVIVLHVIPTTAQFANRSDAETAFHNAESYLRKLFR